MKKKKIIVTSLLSLLACCITSLVFILTAKDDPYEPVKIELYKRGVQIYPSLPDRDIVFLFHSNTIPPEDEIRFINVDGTDDAYLTYGLESFPQQITWMDDGSYLFLSHPTDIIFVLTQSQSRLMSITGLRSRFVAPVHGTSEVFAHSSVDKQWAIKWIDIKTGEILAIYPLDEKYEGFQLGTNCFSNGKLLYERWYWLDDSKKQRYSEIVELNTVTNEEHIVIGADGTNPAYSPDGEWIAYTAVNEEVTVAGIYLVRPDGSENHLIVMAKSSWPVAASWSPDGKEIVYHRCTDSCDNNIHPPENSAIFKYNLESGEETMLVENGYYPYWRWVGIK